MSASESQIGGQDQCAWCLRAEPPYRCQQCGEHYCCAQCQHADWPQHRHACLRWGHADANGSIGAIGAAPADEALGARVISKVTVQHVARLLGPLHAQTSAQSFGPPRPSLCPYDQMATLFVLYAMRQALQRMPTSSASTPTPTGQRALAAKSVVVELAALARQMRTAEGSGIQDFLISAAVQQRVQALFQDAVRAFSLSSQDRDAALAKIKAFERELSQARADTAKCGVRAK